MSDDAAGQSGTAEGDHAADGVHGSGSDTVSLDAGDRGGDEDTETGPVDRPNADGSDLGGDGTHVDDVPDGAGCTEIWEFLSERRNAAGETGAVSPGDPDDETEPPVAEGTDRRTAEEAER